MCCKCPPNIPPLTSVYFLLNILFCCYLYVSSGTNIVAPSEIEILSISNCHGFHDKDLHLGLNVNRASDCALTISENVSSVFDSQDEVKINLRGKSIKPALQCENTYTDNKVFSELLQISSREPDNFQLIDRIFSSFYKIKKTIPRFTVWDLPCTRFGPKDFPIEIVRDWKLADCKEFNVVRF